MQTVYKVNVDMPVQELFRNFRINWTTLTPALVVLFGTLAAFVFLSIVKNKLTDD